MEPNTKQARKEDLQPESQRLLEAMSGVMEEKLSQQAEKIDKALGAMAEAADKNIGEVKRELELERKARLAAEAKFAKEVEHLKGPGLVKAVEKIVEGKWPGARASGTPNETIGSAPRARTQSVRARGTFVAKKVYVQGFYDFRNDTGALTPGQRDDLAQRLMEGLSTQTKERFTLERKYVRSRRITFIAKEGGEECWDLREKLMECIETKSIQQDGKDLKIRVEEEPERQARRQAYWRAVDAIKAVAKEGEDFILEPTSFKIYDAKNVESLGEVADEMFEWDLERIRKSFPDMDVPALRRASIQRGRRK